MSAGSTDSSNMQLQSVWREEQPLWHPVCWLVHLTCVLDIQQPVLQLSPGNEGYPQRYAD